MLSNKLEMGVVVSNRIIMINIAVFFAPGGCKRVLSSEDACKIFAAVSISMMRKPLLSPRSANQTKSRDMWQVVCGGGHLEVDEYNIYWILKINTLHNYVSCHCA